jgi:hypothetical protein
MRAASTLYSLHSSHRQQNIFQFLTTLQRISNNSHFSLSYHHLFPPPTLKPSFDIFISGSFAPPGHSLSYSIVHSGLTPKYKQLD